MYENMTGIQHRSAIVDVTDKCNLRCKHCFYFREERDSEQLDDDVFLDGLKTLKERHNIITMGWCGGEPLFRTEVVKQGSQMFHMNQLYTNGTLPIPDMPGLVPFISLDGTREIHDQVRGPGTYDKIMANIKDSPVNWVIFVGTFHRMNHECLEDLVGEISKIKTPSVFMIAMLFTPLKKYENVDRYAHSQAQKNVLDFSWDERDLFVDRLISVKEKYPSILMNSPVNLEMMKSPNSHEATSRCNMPQRTLTLDLKLNRKLPCVLGSDVDCSKCGCPFPFEQEARRRGLKAKSPVPV